MALDESTFLSELREPKPGPGGGSTAALASIVALALVEKICLLELLRAEQARSKDLEGKLREIVALAETFRELAAKDVAAYDSLSSGIKTGKHWPENRGAVLESIDCPRDMILSAIQVLDLIRVLGLNCSQSLIPDLLVALEIISGSARAAFHIAVSNTALIEESKTKKSRITELESFAEDVESKRSEVFENLRRK
jgi:formiminotetrahydrofolate cyclodeaminase